MAEINEQVISQTKMLKSILEIINTEFNVNMCLFQPGIEPLSVIGKTETDILTELRNNIILIFSKYYKTKQVSMNNYGCKKIFGLECEELIKLAGRISTLIPVKDCSIYDEQFSQMPFIREASIYLEEELNKICSNMIGNYLTELTILLEEFNNFATTEEQEIESDMIHTTSISSPQMTSQLFRIFYKGNKNCYCTIADAIYDNQDQKVLS